MHKDHCTFETEVQGDLECGRYHYETGSGVTFKDPFAYLSIDGESIILDKDKFMKDKVVPEPFNDIVIYETSVRDFSSSDSLPTENHRKFLALGEGGLRKYDYFMLGLDYLDNIGITHLQLLPVLDFDDDKTEYNWGYNPVAFNHVKKAYVKDTDDPYAYVNEFRYAVNRLHERNIRVVMDVVFNHVYDVKTFDIEKMIPGHFLRRKPDGSLAAGTMCGSEIRSEDVFVRAYLIEMARRYVELFDIDGLRMDLMGIMDIETVNRMNEELVKIKNDFIVYGEGWNMGDALDERKRASIDNAQKVRDVGMFNDMFRETVIDYVIGNIHNPDITRALSASADYLDYKQAVNYVECHDGPTFYDRLGRDGVDDNDEFLKRKCKLAMALVLLSRGTPFIHAGQEFMGTKHGVGNSYNSGDDINMVDWDLRITHNDMCDYLKDLISLRREHDVFRKDDVRIGFSWYYECLIYRLDDIMIIINPDDHDHDYDDGNLYEILMDINGRCSEHMQHIKVPAHSVSVCKM
ncbi:MAG: hypothetical protein IKX97_05545 [Erysipelotrichaceae bacterium]|nr:hypothetical protein [Erysipelotrichaceae bacterium]